MTNALVQNNTSNQQQVQPQNPGIALAPSQAQPIPPLTHSPSSGGLEFLIMSVIFLWLLKK
jgi:hypothetical protein